MLNAAPPFFQKFKFQALFFAVSFASILVKASVLGSLLGPRLFFFPYVLFYTAIFLTQTVSLFQIFLLGLLHDSIFNLPLGMSGFLWIMWYIMIAHQCRYLIKQPLMILWIVFAGSYAFIQVCQFAILTSLHRYIGLMNVVGEFIFALSLFPFLFMLSWRTFVQKGRNK